MAKLAQRGHWLASMMGVATFVLHKLLLLLRGRQEVPHQTQFEAAVQPRQLFAEAQSSSAGSRLNGCMAVRGTTSASVGCQEVVLLGTLVNSVIVASSLVMEVFVVTRRHATPNLQDTPEQMPVKKYDWFA